MIKAINFKISNIPGNSVYIKDNKVNNYVNDIKSMGCVIFIDRSTTVTETSSTILDHFLE